MVQNNLNISQKSCLDHCFPSQELMKALGVVYLHYKVNVDDEASFPLHLKVIMSFYCVLKKLHISW
jgi:hypothetical protein